MTSNPSNTAKIYKRNDGSMLWGCSAQDHFGNTNQTANYTFYFSEQQSQCWTTNGEITITPTSCMKYNSTGGMG